MIILFNTYFEKFIIFSVKIIDNYYFIHDKLIQKFHFLFIGDIYVYKRKK